MFSSSMARTCPSESVNVTSTPVQQGREGGTNEACSWGLAPVINVVTRAVVYYKFGAGGDGSVSKELAVEA